MRERVLFSFLWILLFGLISGCMGGSEKISIEASPNAYSDYWTASGSKRLRVRVVALDSTTGHVRQHTGFYVPSSSRLELGRYSGDVSSDRTSVALDGAGLLTIVPWLDASVSSFVSQPASGNPTFGSLGVPTFSRNISKRGTATFDGDARVVASDGADVYDLSGDFGLTAKLSSGRVNAVISGLSGTVSIGSHPPTAVTGPFDLSFLGAAITKNRFSGGRLRLSNSSLSRGLSGSEVHHFLGSFFGTRADAVGGAFSLIDDQPGSDTDLTVIGTFVGAAN